MGAAIRFVPATYLYGRGQTNPCVQGEFAIPPGTHGVDVSYYFPRWDRRSRGPVQGLIRYQYSRTGLPSPPFNNVSFIKSFSQSFDSFAIALDPNAKFDSQDITPAWAAWTDANPTEMLFNATANGDPNIHAFMTDQALLERCA